MTGAGSSLAVQATEDEDPSRPSRNHLLLQVAGGFVPLGYAQEADRIYLIARERSARWPVDALRRGEIELTTREGPVRGTIELVTDREEQARVLARFLDKYGAQQYARWYDHPARLLRVRPTSGGAPASGQHQYETWLRAEFDNVAEDYDRHITGNRMNTLLRDRSLRRLRPLFAGARRLLEIGCGSGMETIPMMREGHEILAVDISQRMLDVVRAKAGAEGLSERLTTVRLRAAEIGTLVERLGAHSFDGGYSTYGALNCEPELGTIAARLAQLLRGGSAFFAGVYNRWCLFELLGYGLTLQPDRALGRRQNPVRVGSSRFCVDVFAYSVRDVRTSFGPYFTVEALEGVPVLLPPSDLTSYAEKFSRRFDQLADLDRAVGGWWPFRGLGDHFLMTLRARGECDGAAPAGRGAAAG